jgi:hypothetical protein
MAKCIKNGCETLAEENSIYCASHRLGKGNLKTTLKWEQVDRSGSKPDRSDSVRPSSPRPRNKG